MSENQREKRTGGRPRKFAEPSRPITVTLPDSTLRELRDVDPDLGRAIVKLTKRALRNGDKEKPLVEILKSGDRGLIVVSPSRALLQIPFLHLVEVAPARYVLALDFGHDFKSLEIAVNDALDDVPHSDNRDRELLLQLRQQIKHLRQSDRVRLAEILFVTSPTQSRI